MYEDVHVETFDPGFTRIARKNPGFLGEFHPFLSSRRPCGARDDGSGRIFTTFSLFLGWIIL